MHVSDSWSAWQEKGSACSDGARNILSSAKPTENSKGERKSDLNTRESQWVEGKLIYLRSKVCSTEKDGG
jgi:hypothetical protein